jgi:hypothetical protein
LLASLAVTFSPFWRAVNNLKVLVFLLIDFILCFLN